MDFQKYYRELSRKSRVGAPRADEARRDYQDAISRSIDALLRSR
jgi:hypothetical protein